MCNEFYLKGAFMKKINILSYVNILIGVFLALTPFVIAPVCGPMDNGKFMTCHYMGKAELGLGILLAALALVSIILKDRAKLGVHLSMAMVAVYALILPKTLVATCMHAEMPCNAHTRPMIYVAGGIYLILSVILILWDKKA